MKKRKIEIKEPKTSRVTHISTKKVSEEETRKEPSSHVDTYRPPDDLPVANHSELDQLTLVQNPPATHSLEISPPVPIQPSQLDAGKVPQDRPNVEKSPEQILPNIITIDDNLSDDSDMPQSPHSSTPLGAHIEMLEASEKFEVTQR